MTWAENDWNRLATLFKGVHADDCAGRAEPYAGYKPSVVEAPNGDERVDRSKRYLHVAEKYNPPEWAREYLARAHFEACRVATALGVLAEYRPHEAYGALRVLDYPPGAGTVEHTDFDLFTIVLWRSTPEDLELIPYADPPHSDPEGIGERVGSLGLHIGEIGELVGLGPATPHRVPARPYAQKSIIYFAIPDHAARLPCDACDRTGEDHADHALTVGEWLDERMKRSRVYK